MKKTFRGGIHPPYFKELVKDQPIKKPPAPKKVVIPLSQHTGSPCEPLVEIGENVRLGQKIGDSSKFISAPIHASVSGKVVQIKDAVHPVLGKCQAIVIENDGRDEKAPPLEQNAKDPQKIIRQAGIVGLGGAAFPTHVKLSPPKDKKIDTVILNGAECEPYLACDYRLMLENPSEILQGLEIIIKILAVKKAYIAIEDNKLEAADAMENTLAALMDRLQDAQIQIAVLKTKYPQGAEKQVIKAILNRVVPAGGLPMDIGCVVQNVGTAFAIYEAVQFGKPLTERIITISGSCVKQPVNLKVRIGALLSDLVDSFGGFIKEPKKMIFGGPMMGLAQFAMDAPIIKGTSGIVFLSGDEIDKAAETACIRCGKCIEVCPMNLLPTTLMQLVKKERFAEAKELGIANCFECGACAYECSARVPLLDYIKFGKSKI